MTLFFALLAVLATVVAVAIIGSAVTGDRVGLLRQLRPVAVELAVAVAVTSTLGSLYLSEVAGFDPCRLCWVQRGFMYPAAILLAVALVTRRRLPLLVAGALAGIGLPISIFHRIEQAAGGFGSLCDQDNPCSLRWVEHFGFVTIPTMAAAGFAAVIALVALASLKGSEPTEPAEPELTEPTADRR